MRKTRKLLIFSVSASLAVSLFFGTVFGIELYLKKFQVKAGLQKNAEIDLRDPVVVNFSQPILFVGKEDEIKIEPYAEIKITWENKNRRLVIIPIDNWTAQTNYKIHYPGGRSFFLTQIGKTNFKFATVNYPEVFDVYPQDGQRDVLLDIEDPIIVNFDKSTKGFFIKFVLDPAVEVAYMNNSEKTQFKLVPKSKLQDGKQYVFHIFAKFKDEGDEKYKQIYSGVFSTRALAPDRWEKDFLLRLEQAKKYTRAKIATGKYVDINLDQQILSTFENGKLLDSYLISSGKRGMDTPKGDFKIHNKAPRPWSKKYSLFMPYWMAFTSNGSHGLHELPEWPGGYKEGINHLGIPVSHGCVRLGIGPAEKVYNWVEIGTPVIIY